MFWNVLFLAHDIQDIFLLIFHVWMFVACFGISTVLLTCSRIIDWLLGQNIFWFTESISLLLPKKALLRMKRRCWVTNSIWYWAKENKNLSYEISKIEEKYKKNDLFQTNFNKVLIPYFQLNNIIVSFVNQVLRAQCLQPCYAVRH